MIVTHLYIIWMVLNYMLTVKTRSYSVRAFPIGKTLNCEFVNICSRYQRLKCGWKLWPKSCTEWSTVWGESPYDLSFPIGGTRKLYNPLGEPRRPSRTPCWWVPMPRCFEDLSCLIISPLTFYYLNFHYENY